MDIVRTTSKLTFPVIVEGEIYSDVLRDLGLDEGWIKKQLKERDIMDIEEVFFASINKYLELQVSLYEENLMTIPAIKH
jgi:uncharacterized membrane protein YcaP (DUF421 family)